MNYYFEFAGGLGDIFFRMFAEGEYRGLVRLQPSDRARISLITVNPFAHELFEWHPKRSQLSVSQFPHWVPDEDEAKRVFYSLPTKEEITCVPASDDPVKFYPAPSDATLIARLEDAPYFVLAASAGGEWRVIPDSIVRLICEEAQRSEVRLVGIGRNYLEQRGGLRHEPPIPISDSTLDLIDQLTVPGSAKLVEGSLGVICSHSSICLLSWLLNKPTLLLYPEEVYRRAVLGPRDGYMFGLERPTTKHTLFSDCTREVVSEFLAANRSNGANID